MQPRSDDQPFPERETDRDDPAAGRAVREANATPDPRTREAGPGEDDA